MYGNCGLFLLLVIATGSVSAAAATGPDITCNKTDLETSCSVKLPDRVVVHNESVYLGLENKLVRFGLKLDVQSVVERNPSADAVSKCERYRQPHCGNYILTMLVINLTSDDIPTMGNNMLLVNKTVLFICSTFGFSPQCQLCDAKNISHCVNVSDEVKNGYSPYDRRFNNVYTLTKDHVFYTGSSFDDKNRLQAVAKAHNPFHGSRFSLHTDTSQTWLFNPTFISLYEVDQYVYFFWREEAFEADRRVYTRVGRLCKSDKGLGNNSSASSIFSTFVKARMACIIPEDNDNRHPFEYNELQATYLVNETMLYAVFSTPSNGPASSAICTYTFGSDENSLNTVFNGDYLFGNSGSETWTTVINPAPFDCPGDGPNQRSKQDAKRYLLMEESVQQSTPLPIYIETGAYITALVVDTVQWNGIEFEVLYIGLSNGVVKQVMKNISEIELYAVPSNQPVNKLILYENKGTKFCYITSDDNIAVIQLGHCDYYQNCSQCTNDIYCRWNGHSCTNDISITADVTCPTQLTPEPTTTVNSVDVTTVYQTSVVVVTIQENCSIPTTGPVGNVVSPIYGTGGNNMEETCNDIPIVVGAMFGGLALGFIIGAIVFVTIYFIKRSQPTPKESTVRQGSIESKEYDDDTFDPPTANQYSTNCYTHRPPITNGRTDLVNMSIGHGHLAGQVGRNRTESTKRLISISSDLYPDSPSPPSTLRMPKHDEI